MSDNELVKAERVVGEGSTQLLCETYFNIDPPLTKVLEQRFEVVITDYTVFVDKVMFKGLVEKSLIYKHPHLKKKFDKMKDENKDENKKDDSNKNEGRDAGNTCGGKKDDEKKEGTDKADVKHDCEKKNAKTKDSINKEDLHCSSQGWCIRLDSNDGIVHFYEEILQFTGIVKVCGVMPGDNCHFVAAEVRDYEAIVPTETDKNGLVRAASQMFIITVEVNVTRPKQVCVKTDKKCESE